jgi:hypothetical protein
MNSTETRTDKSMTSPNNLKISSETQTDAYIVHAATQTDTAVGTVVTATQTDTVRTAVDKLYK